MSVKILLFSQYFPPEMGALAARSYEHGRRWAVKGHQVTVICETPNYPEGVVYSGFRNRLFQRAIEGGIEVVRTWVLPLPNRKAWERMLNYLSYAATAFLAGLRVPKPDVIIGSSPQLLTAVTACLVARLRRVPFVLEIRDLWPESLVAAGPAGNRLLVRILRWVARFLYRWAHKVVVVTTPFQAYLIQRMDVPASKIEVIPNGVDLEMLKLQAVHANDIAKEYGLEEKFVVSYVGTIGAAHGIRTVLDAAEKFRNERDVVFLLVGDGAKRRELEQECARRKLKNVVFTGRQSKERALALLEASAVSLVLLRRRDLFKTVLPSKMLEAMAMSNPVILGVEGEARRLLEEAKAGVAIAPEDVEALVAAIERLRADETLRYELGQNGREYIQERYDRIKLADAYADLLVRVASSKK
jgi:glycosyltransferase involved in cell wall biosynthesis